MSYPPAPPVYPLRGNYWIPGTTPAANPPAVTLIHNQLYIPPANVPWIVVGGTYYQYTLIKTPPDSVVYNRFGFFQPDNGQALYYYIIYKEYYYRGFVSCFEGLCAIQCNANGSSPRTY